jgi:hypothetical protein
MTTTNLINLGGVIVAAAAVVVALAAMIWQARQTHASNSVANMWRFLDAWDSSEMHRIRIKACRSLKVSGDADEITDLLGFFEELGFLVRRRSLDADTAWAMFSDWALPYWKAAEYFITRDQRDDRTLWEDFEFLNRRLLSIEAARKHRSIREVQPTSDDVEKLLEGELRLTASKAHPLSPTAGQFQGSSARTFSSWRRRTRGRPRTSNTDERSPEHSG